MIFNPYLLQPHYLSYNDKKISFSDSISTVKSKLKFGCYTKNDGATDAGLIASLDYGDLVGDSAYFITASSKIINDSQLKTQPLTLIILSTNEENPLRKSYLIEDIKCYEK